jgi:isopentenyl diphosphate isomerase/L-lactate dehydrogenase-like FMN-dependent dehydrogenase
MEAVMQKKLHRRTSMKYFGQYQDEIYAAGLHGVVPKLPIDSATLERKAVAAWPDMIASYVQGGCGDERTQDLNVAAFRKWGLVPRMLVDGSKRDMSIKLFGMKLSTPIDGGVDGIYCSTHGGRQANGGVGCLDMLPAVVEAAGKTPVLFDSGVRSGSDIVKALALGATAVGVGRPYAWGLALDGTDGVVHVLRCLLVEADLLMAIDGYPTIGDLRSATLMRS